MGTAKLQWHDNYNFIEPVTYSGQAIAIGWSDNWSEPNWWSGWHDIWTVSIPKGHIFSIDALNWSTNGSLIHNMQVQLYINGSLVLNKQDITWWGVDYGSFGNYTSQGGTTILLKARLASDANASTGEARIPINWRYTTGKEGSEDL